MPQRDRLPKHLSSARPPDPAAGETPANLAATLAQLRQEALARVTAQLNGKPLSQPEPRSLFGDVRRSIGKAVAEQAAAAGVPQLLPATVSPLSRSRNTSLILRIDVLTPGIAPSVRKGSDAIG